MSTKKKAKRLLGTALVKVGLLDKAATGAPRRMTEATPALKPEIDIPDTYGKVEKLLRARAPMVFVSGNAGTGKTTLIRYLTGRLPQRSVIVAPTGVAALNAEGVTVHSFFQFPPRIQDPREIRMLADRKLIRKLDLLIVDEVSMLRCDVLDSIDLFLRKNRETTEPFGGVQLLFVGDLFQLPPVVPRSEREVLEAKGYASPYFFSAFGLREVPLAHVELDHVYRQDDPAFVRLLNNLRVAEATDQVVDEINGSCRGGLSEDYEITLTCTNKQADEINAASMEAIHSAEHVFHGDVEGDFRLNRGKLPSPLDLRLKQGARVMFTKNDDQRRWVNGTSGVVKDLYGDLIRVQIGGQPGSTYEVERVAWESYEYVLDPEQDRIVAQKIGEYRQYPLMLAWAVTIHKSQGKTLGSVLIDFGSRTFASGQAYVALSRCRSLDGIRLARPLRAADVKFDPTIRRFYEALMPPGGD